MAAQVLDGDDSEHWLQRWWRPAMAWQAFAVGICDFIIFPMINSVLYAAYNKPFVEWHPLSLQGGGMYWIAMGAIVGVTSWQRSNEKMASFGAGPFGGSSMMTVETDQMTTTRNGSPQGGAAPAGVRPPLVKTPHAAG